MTGLERLVRWLVYQHFLSTGSPPPFGQLVRLAEHPEADVRAALQSLHRAQALVLRPDTDAVWMAHPFSGVPTDYRVETGKGGFFANCAWDALAIPALIGRDARIHARHAVTGEAMQLEVRDGELQPTLSVVHFAVPARRFWDDIGFT